MVDKPDLDALARQYLNLWQDHLTDLAADGDVAETVAKSIELMNGSAAAFAKMAEQNLRQSGGQDHDEGNSGTVATGRDITGAASAASVSGNADDVVAQLTRRIGELEQRIDKLESKTRRAGKKSGN